MTTITRLGRRNTLAVWMDGRYRLASPVVHSAKLMAMRPKSATSGPTERM